MFLKSKFPLISAMAMMVSQVAVAQPSTTAPVLSYEAGSSIKLQQLLGQEDKELHKPTLSQTFTQYGIRGTDLGNSFESGGLVYFLFGDTVGRLDHALDTIATTNAGDPESGVRLDFLKSGNDYLTIQPPGISMGAFEVPVAGINLGGQVYVAVSTNHSEDRSTDRSVLTKFTLPASFQPLRQFLSFLTATSSRCRCTLARNSHRTAFRRTIRLRLGHRPLPQERRVSLYCAGRTI